MTVVTWKNTPTQTINVGGTPFAYRELGPRGGVPLVFLHHFTAVLDDWDPRVIDGIAAKRHVIAFDNRGIGASGGSVPHTIDEMAADAVAFIRALGHEQVDLLGFSLGGGVAQVITLEHPELVRRLILAGTGRARWRRHEKMPLIVGSAYTKAALTRRDPRHFLFFNRNAAGKRAASEYMARLKERTDRPRQARSPTRRASHSSRRFARPASATRTTSARSLSRSSWPTATTTSWSPAATPTSSPSASPTRSSRSTRTPGTAGSSSTTGSSSPRSSSSSRAE